MQFAVRAETRFLSHDAKKLTRLSVLFVARILKNTQVLSGYTLEAVPT